MMNHTTNIYSNITKNIINNTDVDIINNKYKKELLNYKDLEYIINFKQNNNKEPASYVMKINKYYIVHVG